MSHDIYATRMDDNDEWWMWEIFQKLPNTKFYKLRIYQEQQMSCQIFLLISGSSLLIMSIRRTPFKEGGAVVIFQNGFSLSFFDNSISLSHNQIIPF